MRVILEILPDSIAPLAVEMYARAAGWRSTDLDGDVGAFAGAALAESILGTMEQERGEAAAAAARAAARAEVRRNVTVKLV